MKRLALFALFLAPLSLAADVKLPAVFSEGAVLQRGREIPVWGTADAGEKVSVAFAGKSAATTASADGRWNVTLPACEAGGPWVLSVKGKNTVSVSDVLVGEVWLASGQSNMELPVFRLKDRYADIVAGCTDPWVRTFKILPAWNFDGPQAEFGTAFWRSADPKSVLGFSGVAYFFARELREKLNVPVGVVDATLGGCTIQSWMGEAALVDFPEDIAEGRRWRDADLVKTTMRVESAAQQSWDTALDAADSGLDPAAPWFAEDFDDSGWALVPVPLRFADVGFAGSGSVWLRRTFTVPAEMAGKAARLNLGRIVDADTAYVNGVKVGNVTYQYPPRRYEIPAGLLHAGANTVAVRVLVDSGNGELVADKPYEIVSEKGEIPLIGRWKFHAGVAMGNRPGQTFIQWKPTGLFNAMVAPLGHYPVAGVLWYQGESNSGDGDRYGEYFKALVAQYRGQFGEKTPVIMMQLPNFMEPTSGVADGGWAKFRDVQRRSLAIPGTALAVGIDLGDWNDIHPENKADVGHRMALAARRLAYGEKNLASSGPLVSGMRVEGGKAVLSFTEVAGGLVAFGGGELRQFTIAGADGVYHEARAWIEGESVIVASPAVREPVSVRYAWANNPVGPNLSNTSGLPASPFEISAK